MLDPYSLEIRNALLARFPEWLAYCREEPGPEGESSLIIDVPPPPESGAARGLRITTEDEEITVGFDSYHAHYDVLGPCDDPAEPTALDFIEGLLSERIAVVSWWHGERWLSSAQLHAGELLELPRWVDASAQVEARVRSWRGTQNHLSYTRESV
jgi:hypothetical protein